MIEVKRDRLLTVQETAEFLGVAPTRVRALIQENRLPAEKHGKSYVIRESDLLRYKPMAHGRPPSAAKKGIKK